MQQRATTISLTNITKRFGELEAVSDATVSVKAGEVVGFVGPNGAGKTTTISMMMGFIRPTLGQIKILGRVITPETAHAVHKDIGYVAGDMVLPDALTGKQFLAFCAAKNGREDTQFVQLVDRLQPILDRPLKQLSRGNKQKIALIAALQHAPSILIMDEPTSGLDPLMQEIFLKTVQTEARRGTTVFMSSHILSEVSSICDRVIFMRAGKFIVDKPIHTVTDQLGKHVIITTPEAKKLVNFLPSGVQMLSQQGKELRVQVSPDELKPFMRWLMTKNFDDIVIENRDLDDVFHELYTATQRGRRA